MFKCFMFDFGDTLAKDERVYRKIDKEYNFNFFKKIGFTGSLKEFERIRKRASNEFRSIPSQKQFTRGIWAKIVAKEMGLNLSDKESLDYFKNFMEYYKKNVELHPGVDGILKFLKSKGCECILISNNWIEIHSVLEYLKIKKYFDTIILSEEINSLKSELKPFEIALKKTRISPEECLMIGDRLGEDNLCRKFGIKFCWFNPENNFSDSEDFDFQIKNFISLKKFV